MGKLRFRKLRFLALWKRPIFVVLKGFLFIYNIKKLYFQAFFNQKINNEKF